MNKEEKDNMICALVSIYDYLKLCDGGNDMQKLNNETLSEMLFRKFKSNNICLKEFTGLDYLKPTPYEKL